MQLYASLIALAVFVKPAHSGGRSAPGVYLETSTSRQTLSADGFPTKIARLDGKQHEKCGAQQIRARSDWLSAIGARGSPTGGEMEKFVESFPVEKI